jgi:hypothetical protein
MYRLLLLNYKNILAIHPSNSTFQKMSTEISLSPFSEFYTTITYIVSTSDGNSIPSACFNPSLIEPMHSLCNRENKYLTQIPVGFIPSFTDLKGNYSENLASSIMSTLQGKGRL